MDPAPGTTIDSWQPLNVFAILSKEAESPEEQYLQQKVIFDILKGLGHQATRLQEIIHDPKKKAMLDPMIYSIEKAKKETGYVEKEKRDYVQLFTSYDLNLTQMEEDLSILIKQYNPPTKKEESAEHQPTPSHIKIESKTSSDDTEISEADDEIHFDNEEQKSQIIDDFLKFGQIEESISLDSFITKFEKLKLEMDPIIEEGYQEILALKKIISRFKSLANIDNHRLNAFAIRANESVAEFINLGAVTNSVQSDEPRIQYCKELKKKWTSVVSRMDYLYTHLEWLKICDQMSFAQSYMNDVKGTILTFSKFLDKFNDSCITSLDMCLKKNPQPNFEVLKSKLNELINSKSYFSQIIEKLKEFKIFHSQNRTDIITALKNIPIAQMAVENNYKAFYGCYKPDDPFIQKLISQKCAINEILNDLAMRLKVDWKVSCQDLKKLEYDLELFPRFVNLELNLSICFLNLKEISHLLRKTRKNDKSRSNHTAQFNYYNQIYKDMCSLWFGKDLLLYKEVSPFPDTSITSLENLYDKTICFIERHEKKFKDLFKQQLPAFKNKLEFAWIELENPEEIVYGLDPAKLKALWKEFKDKITLRIKNMEIGFESIYPLFESTAIEVNQVGRTTKIKTTDFDDDFTQAYYSNNPVMKLGTKMVNGIWPDDDQYNTYVPVLPPQPPPKEKNK